RSDVTILRPDPEEHQSKERADGDLVDDRVAEDQLRGEHGRRGGEPEHRSGIDPPTLSDDGNRAHWWVGACPRGAEGAPRRSVSLSTAPYFLHRPSGHRSRGTRTASRRTSSRCSKRRR